MEFKGGPQFLTEKTVSFISKRDREHQSFCIQILEKKNKKKKKRVSFFHCAAPIFPDRIENSFSVPRFTENGTCISLLT